MTKTVSVVVYKKNLEKHLLALKLKRAKDLAEYDRQLMKWRADLTAWVGKNHKARIQEFIPRDHYRFDGEYFFRDAPRPPSRPADTAIRRTQSLLRHLTLTNQTRIRVTSYDTDQLFASGDE